MYLLGRGACDRAGNTVSTKKRLYKPEGYSFYRHVNSIISVPLNSIFGRHSVEKDIGHSPLKPDTCLGKGRKKDMRNVATNILRTSGNRILWRLTVTSCVFYMRIPVPAVGRRTVSVSTPSAHFFFRHLKFNSLGNRSKWTCNNPSTVGVVLKNDTGTAMLPAPRQV